MRRGWQRLGMPSAVSVRRGRQRDQDAFLTQQEDVLPRRQLRAGARGHLAEDAGPGAERRQRLGRVSRFLPVPTLAISRGWGGLRHEGRGAGQELPLPRGGAPPSSVTERYRAPSGGGGIIQSPSPRPPQGTEALRGRRPARPGPRGGAGTHQRFCPSSSSPAARSSALLLLAVAVEAAEEAEEKLAAEPSPEEEEPKEPALPTAAAIFPAASSSLPCPAASPGRGAGGGAAVPAGTRMLGGRARGGAAALRPLPRTPPAAAAVPSGSRPGCPQRCSQREGLPWAGGCAVPLAPRAAPALQEAARIQEK